MPRLSSSLLSLLTALYVSGGSQAHAFYPIGSPEQAFKNLKNSAMEEKIKGNPEAALELYEKLVELAKQQYGADSTYVGELYFEMGSLALKATKFPKAQLYLTEAVKINPNSANARTKLAELLLLRDDRQEAANQAEKVLQKHPDALGARLAYASALDALGDSVRSNRAYANLGMVIEGKKAPVPMPPKKPKPPPPPPPPKAVEEPKPEPAPEPKPKEKPKPKEAPKPKPKPEPKPKPKAEPKPEPKPPAPKAEPKPKPVEMKAKPAEIKVPPQPPAAKPPKSRPAGGLVPPPPPMMPGVLPGGFVPPPPPMMGVGAGSPGFALKTEAKVKDKPKPPKETPKEDKPASHGSSGGGDESDFLLDWAADKGGKKKGHKED